MATYKSGKPLPPDHPLHPDAPAMIIPIRRLRPAAPSAPATPAPVDGGGAAAGDRAAPPDPTGPREAGASGRTPRAQDTERSSGEDHPLSKPSKSSRATGGSPTNLLAKMDEELVAELRASGITVTDRPMPRPGRCTVSFVPRRRREPAPRPGPTGTAGDEPRPGN